MAPSTRSKTAEMKRLKKLPSISCSIYRRDVFSFLEREQLEELREVSHRFNADIATWNAKKPRQKLHELTIGKRGLYVKKDGSLNARTAQRWQDWREASANAGCCRGLKISSQELVGELIYTDRDEAEIIAVSLACDNESGKEGKFMLATLNRLDKDGAFELIHLLRHVDSAALTTIDIAVSDAEEENGDHLNPLLFATLDNVSPSGAFRVFTQSAFCSIRPDDEDPGAINFSHKLSAYGRFAKCASYYTENHPNELASILALLVSGQIRQRVVVQLIGATSEQLNWIIKYLRDEITGLAQRIPTFEIGYNTYKKLPEVCRPLVETGRVTWAMTGEAAFEFRNETEGRDFHVIFVTGEHDFTPFADSTFTRMKIEFARL